MGRVSLDATVQLIFEMIDIFMKNNVLTYYNCSTKNKKKTCYILKMSKDTSSRILLHYNT